MPGGDVEVATCSKHVTMAVLILCDRTTFSSEARKAYLTRQEGQTPPQHNRYICTWGLFLKQQSPEEILL